MDDNRSWDDVEDGVIRQFGLDDEPVRLNAPQTWQTTRIQGVSAARLAYWLKNDWLSRENNVAGYPVADEALNDMLTKYPTEYELQAHIRGDAAFYQLFEIWRTLAARSINVRKAYAQGGHPRTPPDPDRCVARIVLAQFRDNEIEVYWRVEEALKGSLAKWLALRYGEQVNTQPAQPEVLPRLRPPGAPCKDRNTWARAQFEAGKTPADILPEYAADYPDDLATSPRKALESVHRAWRRAKNPNKDD